MKFFFFLLIFLFKKAPQIQNALIESELMVYGILGFIKLQAGIQATSCPYRQHEIKSKFLKNRRIYDYYHWMSKNRNTYARL